MYQKTNSLVIERFLPFFLLFSQYKFGPITLGEIGILILTIVQIIKNHGKLVLRRDDGLILLFMYVLLKNFVNGVSHPNSIQIIINSSIEYVVMYIASMSLTNKSLDEDVLYKSWKVAGVIFSLGLIFQIISIYVFGGSVKPISIIPGYNLRGEELSLRPSSFFAEPASFVCAMLPLVFIALKKNDYIWAFMSTLIIIVSTSTVGIILTGVLWLVKLLQSGENIGRRLLLILLSIIGIYLISKLNIFAASIQKLFSVLNGESTVGSRIICGLDTIRTIDMGEWIFGTTYHDSSLYLREHINQIPPTSPVHTYFYVQGSIFMNTFSYIIFHYGLVGLFLYFNSIYRRLFKKNCATKPYLFMMFVSIFGQSKFLNSVFFMELMLILLYDNIATNKNTQIGNQYNDDM